MKDGNRVDMGFGGKGGRGGEKGARGGEGETTFHMI